MSDKKDNNFKEVNNNEIGLDLIKHNDVNGNIEDNLVAKVSKEGRHKFSRASLSSLTSLVKKHGYSLTVAALFVAGENAGCALLALPNSIRESGWIGLFLIFLLCINAGYAGIVLARCWLILEERWEKYRLACREPYPAIGQMAFGTKMRALVTTCVQITLIGSMVVILLLAAQIITNIAFSSTGICFCTWLIILAAILTPLTWFGTPSEFWPAAAGALLTTTIAVILILIDCVYTYEHEAKEEKGDLKEEHLEIKNIFLAFGTIMFAYGATASFPTFQNDMKDKRKFPYSVLVGFIVLILLYAPTAVMGFLTFGQKTKGNIILNLPDGPRKLITEILMASHLLFAFLLCATAPLQEIESALKLPHRFTWKRPAIRSSVMVFTLFLALSVPNFGKVLDLIGGSAIAMLSYILPPIFYYKLCSVQNPNWQTRTIPMWEKIFLTQIMLVGLFGGIACTYSAVVTIWGSSSFTYPCYIKNTCDVIDI